MQNPCAGFVDPRAWVLSLPRMSVQTKFDAVFPFFLDFRALEGAASPKFPNRVGGL